MSLPRLSRATLAALADNRARALPTPAMFDLPERVVQFGTGAFLRGFVEHFIDAANAAGTFNGRIVAVGSTGSGRDQAFADQDGLYTLVARGVVGGGPLEEARVIASVSRALSAVSEWEAVLACARNPELSLVFSNTTEVGIALDPEDRAELSPPRSFPGKLTRFLYERAVTFGYATERGVVVVPCELIEGNGDVLRRLVLELGEQWGYGASFREWIESSVPFVNTLVDRIVPGAPDAAEAAQLSARFGYHDALLTTSELFRLFVIEGDEAMRDRLGFVAGDPFIIVTDNIAAYRQRKVSLLNGAHTIAVSAALLAGCETVHDAMSHAVVGPFIRRVLLKEILPTVQAPDAERFALAVLDRFENPHIRHALVDITLQGTTKLRVRIVPTIIRAVQRTGRVPDGLALGFAAHLAYLHPRLQASRAAAGRGLRVDDAGARISARWAEVDGRASSLTAFAEAVCADVELWDADLTVLPGLVDTITHQLHTVQEAGIVRALEMFHSVPVP